jgi:transcriptional regulator GlxA family with amidase domain
MFPHQWLMRRRLDRASVLLRRSDLPLADIAASCGFAGTQHLVRAVTRTTGKAIERV